MIRFIAILGLGLVLSFTIIRCTKNVTSEDVQEIRAVSDQRFNSDNEEDYRNEDFNLLVKKYEDPNRESWQNPELILDKLRPFRNKTVADIGVGTGFFTFRLVKQAEKVIAIDVENRFLEYIEERKYELKDSEVTKKIETRLCPKDDPHLKSEEVDIALIVNTYHYIENRGEYLAKVRNGLTHNGRVTIVDYKIGVAPVGPPETMKVPLTEALEELKESGFEIIDIDTTSLEFQYIVTGLFK